MLTSDGLRERQWGRFPALRQALEDKKLSETYFGWCSVCDNIFDQLHRTLTTGMLARDNRDIVAETAERNGWPAMHRDLELLARELQNASEMLHRLAEEVEALHRLEHESPR